MRGTIERRLQVRSDAPDEGAAMVEFAFVFVIFLVVVFGIIDFGLAISADTQISNAGREGARLATLVRDPAVIEARVRDASDAALDQALMTVVIECEEPAGLPCLNPAVGAAAGSLENAQPGDTARITVRYPYSFITPLPTFINQDGLVALESMTEMRVE